MISTRRFILRAIFSLLPERGDPFPSVYLALGRVSAYPEIEMDSSGYLIRFMSRAAMVVARAELRAQLLGNFLLRIGTLSV